MNEDTKLSDLAVAEFRKLMQECLQQDMDAEKEVDNLRAAFNTPPFTLVEVPIDAEERNRFWKVIAGLWAAGLTLLYGLWRCISRKR
jgi:uncharacterized NAD(P)/FAD-binding protein YdhS